VLYIVSQNGTLFVFVPSYSNVVAKTKRVPFFRHAAKIIEIG